MQMVKLPRIVSQAAETAEDLKCGAIEYSDVLISPGNIKELLAFVGREGKIHYGSRWRANFAGNICLLNVSPVWLENLNPVIRPVSDIDQVIV